MAISGGAALLALAGVATAAVLVATASLAVLWPLLIGCACVAAIGLVVFAIAGFQAWYRKAPALTVTIGKSMGGQVSSQIVNLEHDMEVLNCGKVLLGSEKVTYLEFELTLAASDSFLSTFKFGDNLYIRGNFCDLSLEKGKKIAWNGKQDIKLRVCSESIIDRDNYLWHKDGRLCVLEFLKNNKCKNGSPRTLKLQSSTAG
jgi:hypothetical protein